MIYMYITEDISTFVSYLECPFVLQLITIIDALIIQMDKKKIYSFNANVCVFQF